MNKITKIMAGLLLAASVYGTAFGQSFVNGTVNKSATGTTSATVVVEPSNAPVEITDLRARFDSGVSTGLVVFRSGDAQYQITSSTSASQSVVSFANTGTAVGVGEYIIVFDASAGDYLLRHVTAATTTSVTVNTAITPALTVLDDIVWSVDSSVERPTSNLVSGTDAFGRVWLPAGRPTAVTVDGNTTACRISLSGVRGTSK